MSDRAPVVIVGGGVAGAMTAMALARMPSPPDVVLIDRTGRFARGVAYSTESETHLLNVAAGGMSVFADDPEHFLRWARGRSTAGVAAEAFLPRKLFGDYVAETFAAASVRDDRRVIRTVSAAAIDVEPGAPVLVRCADGARIAARHVVVALGNDAPADPPVERGASFYASRRYDEPVGGRRPGCDRVRRCGAARRKRPNHVRRDTGAPRARAPRAFIHVSSRRGLLPCAHASAPAAVAPGPSPDEWLTVAPQLSSLLRAVRRACEHAPDWRSVIDSLRAVSGRLWERLDARERARFLARVRPFWDAHRHRAPVVVERAIAELVAAGVVRRHAGRIREWHEDAAASRPSATARRSASTGS
jgi:uncharacterized NAD(P)/FAD-binding protein YdhS